MESVPGLAVVVAEETRRDARAGDVTRADLIAHAVRAFELAPHERELLVLLLDAMLDGAHDRKTRVNDAICALRDADAGAIVTSLGDGGALAAFALITLRGDGALLDRQLALHDDFWPRLVGAAPRVRLIHATQVGPDELARAPAVVERIAAARAWMRELRGRWATVVVHGPSGSGRGAVAHALAAELGCGVLAIDGGSLTASTVAEWRREIAWHQAVPVIEDADRADPAALTKLAQLAAAPLVVTSTAPIVERLLTPHRAVNHVELERLTARERAAIWRAALGPSAADGIDTAHLGARFPFAPARVVAAAAALADGTRAPTTDAAVALCRSIPEVRVGGLAARMPTPYGWSDLVVSSRVRAELELIATWGRRGAALFGPDGVGGRARAPRGLACLFHGPPGTGKTLAAQVVAGELGLELYRVDLAQVVDKYIGETEKRLDQLFREAEAAGVVLFFDEADALFAQRTEVREARDRYANLETGFLLQRLEDHAGLTILASNLLNNLDPAFQRRLGVVVELPLPGPVERGQIWDKLLPAPAQRAPDLDIDLLAQRIAMSGGDIRNAVVAAVLIAERDREPLAGKHVAIAAWREMVKAGRLFDPADLGPWQAAIVAYAGAQRR